MLSYSVSGAPVAQPRPRLLRNGGVFNPHDADHWKAQVKFATTQAVQAAIPRGWPLKSTSPLFLQLVFMLPRPAGHFLKSGQLKEKCSDPFSLGRQDVDNLSKAVMDAMTGAIASPWADDNHVVALSAIKIWTARNPGVTITLVDLSASQHASLNLMCQVPSAFEKLAPVF